jgi:hypothetical protein
VNFPLRHHYFSFFFFKQNSIKMFLYARRVGKASLELYREARDSHWGCPKTELTQHRLGDGDSDERE